MKFVIYGAGYRGKKLLKYLGTDCVSAFIDSDISKIGGKISGKPIISIDDYMIDYSMDYIIISPAYSTDIESFLEEKGLYNYSNMREMPSEFNGYGNCSFDVCYSDIAIAPSRKYIIYGINAFSLKLYDFLNGRSSISIMAEKGCHYEKVKWLKRNMQNINIIDEPITEGTYLITHIDVFSEKLLLYEDTVDLLEHSNNNPLYYNSTLESLHNCFAEKKRCFIVATGPSLLKRDLDTLDINNEFCFSMNSIIKMNDVHWIPDAYVCTDSFFINENAGLIKEYECKFKFIGDAGNAFWEGSVENAYKIHVVSNNYSNRYDFSNNICQKVYGGVTVTYATIQIAIYMGFQEIYLLGVDCNYIKGSRNNHFIQDDKKDDKDHQTDKMILSYMSAKEYADEHDIKIYNATRGGMLEVFDRVNFDSLFKKNKY